MAVVTGSFGNQVNANYYAYNNIIKPLLTGLSPLWTFVEDYQPSGPASGSTFSTWKSPGASNHSGMDWYLVFGYQTPLQSTTGGTLAIYAVEVYNTSGHTWNRPVLASNGTFGSAYSPTLFDATNQYAYTAVSPNVVGTVYQNLVSGNIATQFGGSISFSSGGVNSYIAVANADGFALAAGTSGGGFVYVGAHSSFLPVGGSLGTDRPLCSFPAGSGAGASRCPNANGAANTAPYTYFVLPYPPGPGNYVAGGGVNYYLDAFQAGPWAQRLVLVHGGSPSSFSGYYRGVLPDWIVSIMAQGVLFLDSVTINTHTYVCTLSSPLGGTGWPNNVGFGGGSPAPIYFWISTAA